MSYDLLFPSQYSYPKPKQQKAIRIIAFLLISVLLQLSFFYGLNRYLRDRSGIDIEPSTVADVTERTVSLTPPPTSPKMMAISADRVKLALVDNDEIKIFNLSTGRQTANYRPADGEVGALKWLPDNDRLIFAVIDSKIIAQVINPFSHNSGVADETYSSDTFRANPQVTTKEGFQISLYGMEGIPGAVPDLIQTIQQSGSMPEKLELSMSTYTNLLYLNWTRDKRDNLVQVDIMKRIKDIRLPRGKLTKLLVSPRTGILWAELSQDNSLFIYKYQKNQWKLQKYLDGYRLLGVSPDDMLVVAPDQAGRAKEVFHVNSNGDFKPGWAFSNPIELNKVSVLTDGRLLYFDKDRVIVHTPQLGIGTLFKMPNADCCSSDGKMVVSWQPDVKQMKIMEETKQK